MKKATSARLPVSSITAGTQLWPLSRHLCAGCLSFHVCTGAPESVWVLFVVLANVRRTCVRQKLPVLSRLTAEGAGGGGTKPRLLPPLDRSPFRAHQRAPISGHNTLAVTSGPDCRHISSCHHWWERSSFSFFFHGHQRNKIAFKSNCAAARTSGFSGIRPSSSCLTD